MCFVLDTIKVRLHAALDTTKGRRVRHDVSTSLWSWKSVDIWANKTFLTNSKIAEATGHGQQQQQQQHGPTATVTHAVRIDTASGAVMHGDLTLIAPTS